MNLARTFTCAIIVGALLGTAAPAAAQERRSHEPRARQNGQSEAGERRAVPRANGQRPDGNDRNKNRGDDHYRSDDRSDRHAYPSNDDRRSYRDNDDRRRYDGDRRYDGRPHAVPRPYYSRPYFYSRPYLRPYGYVPYRPFYFSQPYYSFRPHLNLGFGLWIGSPVPYPYRYLGGYRPRVYGYPYGYDAGSVSIYGGVSFDLQPSDADLFLDGEYVGRVGDFTPYSEPLTLTPGVHRIAVQRDGFRPMEWEVRIEPGQVIPYRGEMERY